LGFGFWGLGFGCGGFGPNPKTPNPQSPIPNPQSIPNSKKDKIKYKYFYKI